MKKKPLSERTDIRLVKEYKAPSGRTIRRYVTNHTPEEQKLLEEFITMRMFEILSKYMKD